MSLHVSSLSQSDFYKRKYILNKWKSIMHNLLLLSHLIKTCGFYPYLVWKSLSKRQRFAFYYLWILLTSMIFSSYCSRWVEKNPWVTFLIRGGIKSLVPNKDSYHLSSMLRVWVKLRRSYLVPTTCRTTSSNATSSTRLYGVVVTLVSCRRIR